MNTPNEIQVRVEDRVFTRAKAGHPLVDGFRIFQFIQKGRGPAWFVAGPVTTKVSKAAPQEIIMVLGISKAGDVAGFIKRAKTYVRDGKAMVAVASPAIFNQPRYRDAIEDVHIPGVGVLVDEPSEFDVEQLGPWMVRILEVGRAEERSVVDSAFEPLDISARLRDPASGRLDANRISDLLGIRKSDLAKKVCGVSPQALGQNPTSAGIQEKLQPLEDVAQALIWCGGDEAKLRAWLNRPNRDFPKIDDRVPSPMDLILLGHPVVVARKVENLRTGQPA